MRVQIDKTGNIKIFDFNPVQAYKVAVRMEDESIRFYNDLSGKVRDPEARKDVEFLAGQERDHLKTFQSLLIYVKKGESDGFEEDDLAESISSNIFDTSKEKESAEKMDHRHTGFEEAMNMERRSIVFYEGCRENSTTPKARGAFEKIIREERKHLEKFAGLLREKCIESQKGCLL